MRVKPFPAGLKVKLDLFSIFFNSIHRNLRHGGLPCDEL
jgi:hypothetical protein